METVTKILNLPGVGILVLVFSLIILWKAVPYVAALGQALIRFFVNLCFAFFALGFFGFLAFGMIRTIFYPFFGK